MITTDDRGLTLEVILQHIDASELLSGRNELYVKAEAQRDMPVTWTHYVKSQKAWVKRMKSTTYRLWRARGFRVSGEPQGSVSTLVEAE